jgi:hypothetical protein
MAGDGVGRAVEAELPFNIVKRHAMRAAAGCVRVLTRGHQPRCA